MTTYKLDGKTVQAANMHDAARMFGVEVTVCQPARLVQYPDGRIAQMTWYQAPVVHRSFRAAVMAGN